MGYNVARNRNQAEAERRRKEQLAIAQIMAQFLPDEAQGSEDALLQMLAPLIGDQRASSVVEARAGVRANNQAVAEAKQAEAARKHHDDVLTGLRSGIRTNPQATNVDWIGSPGTGAQGPPSPYDNPGDKAYFGSPKQGVAPGLEELSPDELSLLMQDAGLQDTYIRRKQAEKPKEEPLPKIDDLGNLFTDFNRYKPVADVRFGKEDTPEKLMWMEEQARNRVSPTRLGLNQDQEMLNRDRAQLTGGTEQELAEGLYNEFGENDQAATAKLEDAVQAGKVQAYQVDPIIKAYWRLRRQGR